MDAILQETGLSALFGFYIPRVLEYLKHTSWFPFLEEGLDRVNRVVSVIVACLIAAGLTWQFSNTPDGWSLTIGANSSLAAFLFNAARQFALQQFFFEQLRAAKAAAAVIDSSPVRFR